MCTHGTTRTGSSLEACMGRRASRIFVDYENMQIFVSISTKDTHTKPDCLDSNFPVRNNVPRASISATVLRIIK
jgi:hypothetical protein